MSINVLYREMNAILGEDYTQARASVKNILELKRKGHTEAFWIVHTFANAAAPIEPTISLKRPFEQVMASCDYAIKKMQEIEITIDDVPVHTVHTENFMALQRNYTDVLISVKRRISDNRASLGLTN